MLLFALTVQRKLLSLDDNDSARELCCATVRLQVLGNGKGVAAAGVSIAVFGNPMTAMGILGYAVTMTVGTLWQDAHRAAWVPCCSALGLHTCP